MEHSKSDIETIIVGCRKNDRTAQKELYRLFYSYAMSVCIRYSDNREDAVEIMNDSFMRVFQYIKTFNSERNFLPWFRRILINCAIDHMRADARTTGQQLEFESEPVQNPRIEGRLAYEEMLLIIRKLPPAYRAVFNLVAIEGYKHEEVAEMLQISVGTSKSNYFRARHKLQQYLKEYFIA